MQDVYIKFVIDKIVHFD